MTIIEWFDPENEKHMKAWKHLSKSGSWPRDFIPDDVEFPNLWQVSLAGIMGELYCKNFFGGSI